MAMLESDIEVSPMPLGEDADAPPRGIMGRFSFGVPEGEALMAAGVVGVSLIGLWAFRRGLRPGEGHVHVGTSDVLAMVMKLAIALALIKTVIAQPRVADTQVGKALAWVFS